jgi:large subunit ribosomal protein L11
MVKTVDRYGETVPGGQAPAPPVARRGRFGINLGQFVSQFNDRTKEAGGMPIPVVVNVSTIVVRLCHRDFAGRGVVEEGGWRRQGVGRPEQERPQGHPRPGPGNRQTKMADLNARDAQHAERMVEGTARSMGITIEA